MDLDPDVRDDLLNKVFPKVKILKDGKFVSLVEDYDIQKK